MTHHNAQPCRINGVLYASQRAAAAALGVSEGHVSKRLVAGLPDGVRTQSEGKRGNTNAIRRPVVAFGRSWVSQSAMARDLDVDRGIVVRALRKDASDAQRQILLAAVMAADALRMKAIATERMEA